MTRRGGYQKVQEVDEPLVDRTAGPYVRPFPRKEINWGIGLLVLGFLLISLGCAIHLEHLENKVPGSALGYVGLGLLVFVPGAYCSAIAAGAYLGIEGFDYSMVPQMARSV